MDLDWSNIGAHSRGYGYALDNGLEYWVYPPVVKFMIGLSYIGQFLGYMKATLDQR